MRRHTLTAVLAAASLLFASAPSAVAQSMGPDEKELAAYRLTMPTVRKVAAVFRTMAEEMSRDPRVQELEKLRAEQDALQNKDELTAADEARLEKLAERIEAIEEEEEKESGGGNANTIAEMEAAIRKQPAVMKALAREGLTPREYTKCFLALFQAAIIQGFSQGKVDMAKLPPGINPENIKFVQENEKELAELQKEMAAFKAKK